ncbi:MAG: PilN domain-containing protein [Pseudomonadota bacterium]
MQFLTPSIKSRLASWNPLPYIQSFFQTEIREEILQGIDSRLLYLNSDLINLETTDSVENVSLEPVALALAAKKLLLSDSKTKKQNSIALFLPLTEFIYTQYDMPAVDASNIRAALNYQREELLPATTDDLQLTVIHRKQQDNFALWFSQQKAQELFLAFAQEGLTLSAILPRLTLLSNKGQSTKSEQNYLREKSDNYLAQFVFYDFALVQLGHITDTDIKIEAFKQEWETNFSPLDSNIYCLQNKQDWFEFLADKRNIDNYRHTQYAYFPADIKKRFKSRGRLRNSRVIGLIAFILLFSLAVPFIINEVRYWQEETKYQHYWAEAKDIRMMREKVLNSEDEWALYLNYPKVNALDIIYRLNKIIPDNSWISSFQIKNGYVEIDGYSPNPTAILEVISAQNDFNEVAFNQNIRAERGKNKERFGITFHIRDLNIEQYEKEYFNRDN